jgi:hypothetical protein
VHRYLEFSMMERAESRRAYLSTRAMEAIPIIGNWLASLEDDPAYRFHVPTIKRTSKADDGTREEGFNERLILMLSLFWMYDRLTSANS